MKFPKSRRVLLSLLIVFFVLVGAAYFVPSRKPVVVAELYNRLAVGMTEAEVSQAVNIAPGDHTGCNAHSSGPPIYEGELPIFVNTTLRDDGTVSAPHPLTGKPIRGKWWRGGDGLLIVFFGDDNRVIDRRYRPGRSHSWVRYQLIQLDPRLDQLLP